MTRQRPALLTWLCALAIAFQCIIVSGHFHARPVSLDQLVASQPASPLTEAVAPVQKGKVPADDPSTCFICQQMGLAGAAVLPDMPAPVLIEREIGEGPSSVDVFTAHSTLSHHWRSRGPPSLL